MIGKLIYGVALTITVLATLNFVWMAVSPGPKENLFKVVQLKCKVPRKAMTGFYFFVGFCALLTAAMGISYVVKAEECGQDF